MSKVIKIDFIVLGKFVSYGANYLSLSQDVTSEALQQIYSRLKSLDGSVNWMIGDFLCQVEQIRGEEFVAAMLKDWGLSSSRASRLRAVCEWFALDDRFASPLTFTHHEVVMDESEDDPAGQKEWLQRAVAHGWSCSQLRSAIRRARLPFQAKQNQPARLNYKSFYDFARFCTITKAADLSAEDRSALKADCEQILQFLGSL